MNDISISTSDAAVRYDLLPDPVAGKLDRLTSERDDARALMDAASGKVSALMDDLRQAQRELSDLLHAEGYGHLVRELVSGKSGNPFDGAPGLDKEVLRDDARLAAAYDAVERVSKALEAARELSRERSARWQSLSRTVRAAREWLAQARGEVALAEPPRLMKGATVQDIRKEIAELTAQRRKVESAGVTVAEAKRNAKTWVTRQAESVRIAGLLSRNGLISFPSADGVDPAAFACWLQPDAVVAALHREIDARKGDVLALNGKERASQLQELDAMILDAGRREEVLVEQTPGMLRRSGADPRAVLGVV